MEGYDLVLGGEQEVMVLRPHLFDLKSKTPSNYVGAVEYVAGDESYADLATEVLEGLEAFGDSELGRKAAGAESADLSQENLDGQIGF